MEKILTTPKILVLILAIEKDPWKKIEVEGQDTTWKNSCPGNIEIMRYIGTGRQSLFWKSLNELWKLNQRLQALTRGKFSPKFLDRVLRGGNLFVSRIDQAHNVILTTVPDLYSLIGEKTIEAFSTSVDNFDFDYIYRTNVSSYIDLSKLNEFVKNKPREGYYAGAVGNHQGISFASGCGYFLSRDVVNKVLENRKLWDHNLIDDVSLGKLLTKNLSIGVQEIGRMDLDTANFNPLEIEKKSQTIFHYRCKALNADLSIQIMKSLHKILAND
jgi:hypothetical protein